MQYWTVESAVFQPDQLGYTDTYADSHTNADSNSDAFYCPHRCRQHDKLHGYEGQCLERRWLLSVVVALEVSDPGLAHVLFRIRLLPIFRMMFATQLLVPDDLKHSFSWSMSGLAETSNRTSSNIV